MTESPATWLGFLLRVELRAPAALIGIDPAGKKYSLSTIVLLKGSRHAYTGSAPDAENLSSHLATGLPAPQAQRRL